jgi:hypothetical protein
MNSANLKKRLSNTRRKRLCCASESTLRNSAFACFKIDKAKRHQYWMFDVGRSMFGVQSVNCSGQAEFIREYLKQMSEYRYDSIQYKKIKEEKSNAFSPFFGL